ncbi:hypothetical protein [Effusibacillus consociatus]|uniref:DUF4878 domain-containing protein n=1 Tax=Effusibacillus consociatus TaxID=1117041 RepID=A0ABV9PXA5_9BACL
MSILLKKGNYLVISLVIAIFFLFIAFFTNATSPSSTEPVQVLENYLNSVKNMDVDRAATYVIDERYKDNGTKIKSYKKMFQEEKLANYKIESVKFEDKQHALVETTLEIEGGPKVKNNFKLIEQDGQWKVFFSNK